MDQSTPSEYGGPAIPGGQDLPARVELIHENPPFGFFRAHRLFSVRKIISILRGELPYEQVKQLIDEACVPDTSVG